MATEVEPVADTGTGNDRYKLWHIRCCKPAVQRGLCRQGEPPQEHEMRSFVHPDDCCVCENLWSDAHWATCPRDSEYWR